MSKVAQYLQEHLLGEVMTSNDARRYFSTDNSVFSISPAMILYPRNENDVRKTMRFTWQLAERGRIIPVTARGSGTDQTGAALGQGIMMVFPAHMNRILELDSKLGVVTVEPGTNYAKLQQTLMTHGKYIPAAPSSIEYSTIGGALANNSSGYRSTKYGNTLNYVMGLRVVLANGEVIETGKLSKRELNKKLGLSTFEGEIYRAVDALLEENSALIKDSKRSVTKNTAGFNIWDVKDKDSFDLTPLIIGSQGTLGVVTEATFSSEPFNPSTTLLVGAFDDFEKLQKAIQELRDLPNMPCAMEMVDKSVLELVHSLNPHQLKDLVPEPFPQVMLLVEFDDHSDRIQKKMVKKARKILEKHAVSNQSTSDLDEQDKLWKIRHSVATVLTHSSGRERAVPFIEDGAVPIDKYADFLKGVQKIITKNHISGVSWGHAGDGNLTVQPFLDISQLGDRQKLYRLLDEYYSLVISLGGSVSSAHGDGRIRAPFLVKEYGNEVYDIMTKIKKIFDPYNTFNPGVKFPIPNEDTKALLRHEYAMGPWYEHMPRV